VSLSSTSASFSAAIDHNAATENRELRDFESVFRPFDAATYAAFAVAEGLYSFILKSETDAQMQKQAQKDKL
jgi:hypothetical protein